jgi:hypothetical protein
MDDDPVLRALGAEIERDDPALAALLTGPVHTHRGRRAAWMTLALLLIGVALVLAPTVTLGVLAMLLVLISPFLACWWCGSPDDGPAPSRT